MRFLPLRWLPDRAQRLEKPNPFLHVAGHEGGHLLAAMSLGYIGDVSFVPDGQSLARVTLRGDVPIEDMKVIAAAGMVDTPFGRAMGFGSDKFKIKLMNLFYGGKGVGESKSAAEAALNSFGPVRERFSEILAFYAANVNQAISGDVVHQIYQRALGELAFEKKIGRVEAEERQMIKIKPYDREVSTILTERNGYVVVTKVRKSDKDDTIEKFKVCLHCLGVDSHSENCKAVTKETKKQGEKSNIRLFDWKERIKQLSNPALGLIGQSLSKLLNGKTSDAMGDLSQGH